VLIVGVRETLNKQPAITTGATIGIILLALIFIIYQVSGSGRVHMPTKAYYSVDEGATYFSDDINLVPPFDYDGKTAVRANVFKCGGGAPFVGYLQRYNLAAKKVLDDSRTSNAADISKVDQAMMTGLEVKAPLTGDKGWVNTTRSAAVKITAVQCPDGSTSTPEPVLP
jgi:hypothetical protein